MRIPYAAHTFTVQVKSPRWRLGSKVLRLMEPSWGHLQIFGLLTYGSMLLSDQSWHVVWQHAAAWLSNLLPERALAAYLPPLQIKPQTEGKHYKASGVSAHLIHPVVFACASPQSSLFYDPCCGQSGTHEQQAGRHLWAWEWRNLQGCTKGLICLSLGGSRALPHQPSFSIRVRQRHRVGLCVTRVRPRWQQVVALEQGE